MADRQLALSFKVFNFHFFLAWIHKAISEKPELLTDDGLTTDACATTVARLTRSSRAKTKTKEDKIFTWQVQKKRALK